MNFILIKNIILGIGIIMIGIYGYWLDQYRLGLPKAYDDFMNCIIINKSIFEKNNFYTQVYSDFNQRRLPSFSFNGFRSFVENQEALKDADKTKLLNLHDKFTRQLEKKIQTGNDEIFKHDFRVKSYIDISLKWNVVILVILSIVVGLYLFIKPLANNQLLNEYKSVGIQSLDDRYVKEFGDLDIDADVINKAYKSHILGGATYEIEVKIETPIEKTFVLEVDPYLYQRKKVKDTLSINIKYTKQIDKFKDAESVSIDDISILE